jgi:hypothetical protein
VPILFPFAVGPTRLAYLHSLQQLTGMALLNLSKARTALPPDRIDLSYLVGVGVEGQLTFCSNARCKKWSC